MSNLTKRITNLVLCAIAMGTIAFYSICAGSCAYLHGGFFGIDLKYVGIISMIVLIALNLLKKDFLNLLCLSAGLGGEIFLIWFQVRNDTFCPFCLVFGGVIVAQFCLNFDWSKKWYMFCVVAAGFLFFVVFFKGSVIPRYDSLRLADPAAMRTCMTVQPVAPYGANA